MGSVVGAAALILVLYVPGLVWCRVAGRRGPWLAVLYEQLALSALWSGWLALVLASVGVFSLALHVALTLLSCALGLFLGRRYPAAELVVDAPASRREQLAVAVLLVVFAALVARPFETVLGSRDAGVYPNTGYAIARDGSLVIHDELLSSLGQEQASPDPLVSEPARQAETNFLLPLNAERSPATRLRQSGFYVFPADLREGRVVPQFFHLYPAWLGLFSAALGLKGGLVATGYMGLLGLWGVALLGRRLAGPLVGALALAFLGLNTVQVWFSRYTTSETTAQFLLFAGLAAFVAFAGLEPQQRRGRAGVFYGLLAGLALGQVALTRIDFFWGVGPALLFLVYCAVSRRWSRGHGAFAVGLGAMLAHAVAHIVLIARPYFVDTGFARFQDYSLTARLVWPLLTPKLREVYMTNNRSGPLRDETRFWLELAVVLALLLVPLLLWRWPRLLATLERWSVSLRRPLLLVSALAILLLSGYAYLVRPGVLTAEALASPLEQRVRLESYIGAPLPLDPTLKGVYAIALGNMVRMGWYLSPLGVLLGVVGFVLWWRAGFSRRSWLFLIVGLLYSAFFIRMNYGTSDQTYIYIIRRYLPGAYPTFSLGAAYAVAWLWGRGAALARGAGLLSAAALLLFLLGTGWRSFAHVEYGGALARLEELAQRFEPNAVILLRGGGGRDVPMEVATPLIYAFERDALVITSTYPTSYTTALSRQVRHWMGQGRPVYLMLGSNGGSFALSEELQLRQLEPFNMVVDEWQQLQNQKPKLTTQKLISYGVYKVVDNAAPKPPGVIRPDDYFAQVTGFHGVERDQDSGAPYVWTNGAALLRLPRLSQGGPVSLTLRLAAGERPVQLGREARVCARFAAGLLGEQPLPGVAPSCFEVGPEPAEYVVAVPAAPGREPLVLWLEGEAWVPINATAALPPAERILDGRPLLVQLYQVGIRG